MPKPWNGLALHPFMTAEVRSATIACSLRFTRRRILLVSRSKDGTTKQIKLVTSFDWIDFSKLYDAGDMVRDVFSDPRAKELISENRKEAIAQMVERHIESLQTIAESHAPQEDSTEDDVEENIAEDYLPKM